MLCLFWGPLVTFVFKLAQLLFLIQSNIRPIALTLQRWSKRWPQMFLATPTLGLMVFLSNDMKVTVFGFINSL